MEKVAAGWLLSVCLLCSLISFESAVGECVEVDDASFACWQPMVDAWSNATSKPNVIFPLFYLSFGDILQLCHAYQLTRNRCALAAAVGLADDNHNSSSSCSQNASTLKTFSLLFDDACNRSQNSLFRMYFGCISHYVRSNKQCSLLIGGSVFSTAAGADDATTDRCESINSFYECISSIILSNCQFVGLSVLKRSIRGYGCTIASEGELEIFDDTRVPGAQRKQVVIANSDNSCTASRSRTANACLQPLLKAWQSIAASQKQLAQQTSFPIFLYDENDLLSLCGAYLTTRKYCLSSNLVQQCQDESQVRFFEQLFNYPCSAKTRQTFFGFRACIANVLDSKLHCYHFLNGSLQPGLDQDKCENVTQFYSCVRDDIVGNCSIFGLNMFEKTLTEFGCNKLQPDFVYEDCQLEDSRKVSACVAPLMDQWRNMRRQSPLADELIFPLFKYTAAQIRQLCQSGWGYLALRSTCLSGALIKKCEYHPSVYYIEGLLRFPCKQNLSTNSTFVDSHSCVHDVQEEAEQCMQMIRGPSQPNQDETCQNMPSFVECIGPLVEHRCGSRGTTVLQNALIAFRCDIHIRNLRERACEEDDYNRLNRCIQPLMTTWVEVRNRNQAEFEFIFPLYKFSDDDLQEICAEFVEAKRTCLTPSLLQLCPGHTVSRYADSLLGYACIQPSAPRFLDNFHCIADVINEHQECGALLKGISITAFQEERRKCAAISLFYHCVKNSVLLKCSIAGLTTFEATILQFGCDLKDISLAKSGEEPDDTEFIPIVASEDALENSTSTSILLAEIPTIALTSTVTRSEKRVGRKEGSHQLEAFNADGNLTSNDVISTNMSASDIVLQPVVLENRPEFLLDVARRQYFQACADDDKQALNSCLQPVTQRLFEYVVQSGFSSQTVFPLFLLSSDQLLELCDLYANVFLNCTVKTFLSCRYEPDARHVDSLLGYACGNAKLFFSDHFQCISLVMQRSLAGCSTARQQSECQSLAQMFDCVAPDVHRTCEPDSAIIFRNSMRYFGCDI